MIDLILGYAPFVALIGYAIAVEVQRVRRRRRGYKEYKSKFKSNAKA